MFDTNDGLVAGGPGTPQTRFGHLNPKVDFAKQPLLGMAPGSRYIRLTAALNNCGWQVTGGQMWFKCSAGQNVSCDENAPLASADDWEKIACKGLFQGDGPPTGELLCQESEVGDFYFIPDAEGGAARVFLKWKDQCDDSDWLELGSPKSNHPPAEIGWGPGKYIGDIASQRFYIPRLQISRNKGGVSLDPINYKLNIPPRHYIGIRYPASQPTQIVTKEVLTPVAFFDQVVDTTGNHLLAGNALRLPCDGVWEIRARAVFRHPFVDPSEPNAPDDLGYISPDASIALFVGMNGSNSFARAWSPASSIQSWDFEVHVSRSELLKEDALLTLFAYWEDRGSDEVVELELRNASLSCELVTEP